MEEFPKQKEFSVEEYKNLIEIKTVDTSKESVLDRTKVVSFFTFILTDKYDLYISTESHQNIASSAGIDWKDVVMSGFINIYDNGKVTTDSNERSYNTSEKINNLKKAIQVKIEEYVN